MRASDAHPSVDEVAHGEAGCKLPFPHNEKKLAPDDDASTDFSPVTPRVLTGSPFSNLHPWPSYGDSGGVGVPMPTQTQGAMGYIAPWQAGAPERAGVLQQQGRAQLVPMMAAQGPSGHPQRYGLSSMVWTPVQSLSTAQQQQKQQQLLALPACVVEPQVPVKRTALSSKAALWQPKSEAAAAAPPPAQQQEPVIHPVHTDEEEDLWQQQAMFLEQQMESVKQKQLELFASCGEEERQQVLELLRQQSQSGVEAAKEAVVQLERYQGEQKLNLRGSDEQACVPPHGGAAIEMAARVATLMDPGGAADRKTPHEKAVTEMATRAALLLGPVDADRSEHSDESDFSLPGSAACKTVALAPLNSACRSAGALSPWVGRRSPVSWAEISCDSPEDPDLDFFRDRNA